MATSPTFSIPIYHPTPYAYTGLSFPELPCIAQHYLAHVAPHLYDPALLSIDTRRSELALRLFRSLQGTDIALVEKRREALEITRAGEAGAQTQAWWDEVKRKNEERWVEIRGVLLPERESVLDEFMLKFDALVWLESEDLEHARDEAAVENDQRYRTERCAPILEYTYRALVRLDEVIRRHAEAGEAPPQAEITPPSPPGWQEEVQKEIETGVEHTMREIKNTPPSAHGHGRRARKSHPGSTEKEAPTRWRRRTLTVG